MATSVKSQGPSVSPGFNLLRLRPLRAIYLSPAFPYVAQALILIPFVWLAIVGWGLFAPVGVASTDTALAIAAGTMAKPGAFISLSAVSVVSLMLLAMMAYFSLRESRLADPQTHASRVPSLLVFTAASAFLIFGWGFLQ